ncbi:MAG: dihydrofolate reductase [Myxococcales bacterium FL481]|nr:MAG: dihydrofolate reductase [Myxococcales bacterium FL481]
MISRLSIIVAVAENGVIGRNGRLPWRLSNDLRYFRATTMGHPVIMGRRTYESIGRPLPGRTMVVVTRNPEYVAAGCKVVPSFDAAMETAAVAGTGEIFVIGGARLFADTWTRADRLCLTEVHAEVDGDTRLEPFPVDLAGWREVSRQRYPASERDEYDHSIVEYERAPTRAG